MADDALPISRRAVIAGMAGSVALAGCGGGIGGPSADAGGLTAAAPAPPLSTAEADAWMAAAGTTFRAGAFTMRLDGVELIGAPGGRPEELRQQTFIAAFEIVSGGFMPGDLLYTLSHARIPTFDIFLTADSANPARMRALFN